MNRKTKLAAYTAMFAVINYIVFTYGKITIPVTPTTTTAIHLANATVVLSSLFLGPVHGGLAGAVGLSLADLFDPRYITSAPKTFIMKFLIGYIAGKTAQKLKLSEKTERKDIVRTVLLSAAAGLIFNVIVDPIFGYVYKRFVLRIPADVAAITAAWAGGVTALNAAVCTVVASILYLALYKAFASRFNQ